MADYHTVYKGPEGETTQWEDIQRKMGNLPPKEPVWKPEKYTPEAEKAKDASYLSKAEGVAELEDAEDDFADDAALEELRQRRIRELQEEALRASARPGGNVELIRASEFVQKVTEASKEPRWVVVHLFKDGHGASALISQCMEELAAKYLDTKFLRIVSTDCIPKYPDANLPTLLLYHNGKCVQHLVGLAQFGGQRATPEQVALVLNKYGPVCILGDEQGLSDEQLAKKQVRSLIQREVARRAEGLGSDDESSDFDG